MADKAPDEKEQPDALVGSGAPQVKIKANVGIRGLEVGQVTTVPDTFDLRQDAEAGFVTII